MFYNWNLEIFLSRKNLFHKRTQKGHPPYRFRDSAKGKDSLRKKKDVS